MLALWWVGALLLTQRTPIATVFATWPTALALARLLPSADLWWHVILSLQRVFVGLGLAVLLGVPLGVLAGLSRSFAQATTPVFQFLRMISPLSWMPIAVMVLGVGDAPVYFLLAFAAVWPVMLNTAVGVAQLDPNWLLLARSLSASRKNTSGSSKLYAWHAPEVECIAKGKSRTPYEFGVKVGIGATLKHNLIVGGRAFTGNPYDGHTLSTQLEQAAILMQDTGVKPATAYVDLGYRGVDADNPGVAINHRGKYKTLTTQERKLLKRRQAIEPIIGHLKADHRMDRCHLKGEQGDRLHAVLCAAGYNLRWLLRMIAKKGVPFLRRLYLRLCQAAALSPNWPRMLRKLAVHAFRQPAPRLAAA